MNYYLKKRLQHKIERSDMANMLGINYSLYCAIEKGSVKMPINLIDKFNEIINRGKENDILGAESTIKADEFWKEVSQKGNEDKWLLVSKMREFNIRSYRDLAELLGYRSEGTILNYLSGRNPVGDEFKKRLYNFFNDERNIQIPKEVPKHNYTYEIKNESRPANPKLDKYYEKTNFKKIMKEHNITNKQLAEAIGVHDSTVSTATTKKYKPSYKVIQSIKDYLDSVLTNSNESTNVESKKQISNAEYISRTKILEDCEKEISENNAKVEELQKQINEIQAKIELTTKVMEVIKGV